jgi:hypothetical protein
MVTDRFRFPSVLDIREYTTDASNSIPLQFKSVVLRSGIVDTGSFSLVVQICRQWFAIDESGVSTLDDRNFTEKAFGAGSTCAYLPFYIKTGVKAVIEKTELSFDSELSWPQKANRQILQAIEEKNRNHPRMRSLFDSAMLGLVEKIRDLEPTLHYFFNIFCHSNVGRYRPVMKRILNKLLSSRVENVVFAFHYCTPHFASLSTLLLNAVNNDAKSPLLEVLSEI